MHALKITDNDLPSARGIHAGLYWIYPFLRLLNTSSKVYFNFSVLSGFEFCTVRSYLNRYLICCGPRNRVCSNIDTSVPSDIFLFSKVFHSFVEPCFLTVM